MDELERLVSTISKTGRNVTVDNWFSNHTYVQPQVM